MKRQKNDAADAEAIVVAAQRPEMRFVEPRSEERQAKAVLFRARERLVHQRADLVNAPRAVLCESGLVVPQGIRHPTRIEELIVEPDGDPPEPVRDECRDLIDRIMEKSSRIETRTARLREMAAQNDEARRLRTLPGVGPLTALAIDAFAPGMAGFKCGRDFAAWPGLVPRQRSSGGKERLGRVPKRGRSDIRRSPVIGAMSRLNRLGRRSIPEGSWLARMSAKKPRMLVAIALASKMARALRAMLTGNEDCRNPDPAMAA